MVSAANDDLFDQFLKGRGHEINQSWDHSYNKKQCPECGGLHKLTATECTVCGWQATTPD